MFHEMDLIPETSSGNSGSRTTSCFGFGVFGELLQGESVSGLRSNARRWSRTTCEGCTKAQQRLVFVLAASHSLDGEMQASEKASQRALCHSVMLAHRRCQNFWRERPTTANPKRSQSEPDLPRRKCHLEVACDNVWWCAV